MLATVVGPSPNGPQFCHIRYIRHGGVPQVDHESAQISRLEAVVVASPKSLHLCSVCLHQWRVPLFALKQRGGGGGACRSTFTAPQKPLARHLVGHYRRRLLRPQMGGGILFYHPQQGVLQSHSLGLQVVKATSADAEWLSKLVVCFLLREWAGQAHFLADATASRHCSFTKPPPPPLPSSITSSIKC